MIMLHTIKQLSAFDSRIGLEEAKISAFLRKLLDQEGIKYQTQSFPSKTPNYTKAELIADGKKIDCLPCGLVSGEINNSYNLISSLTSSQNFLTTPNINFNPKSDAICVSNFYFAPALAISRKDVFGVMRAIKIRGVISVKPHNYIAQNILVGNAINPKTVVFAHYDGYFGGATDNASGVAAVIEAIKRNPESLKDTLFVLAGNEELSYDRPIYWGRCFRQFNEMNPKVLDQAKSIFIVDCVGDGPPVLMRDKTSIKLAFPIGDFPKIIAKTAILSGNFDSLMTVYHSDADTPERLSAKYLDDASKVLGKLLHVKGRP
jgi:hypothetical protein